MDNQQDFLRTKSKISVIIVNYRSWKHLTNCLNSLNVIVSENFNLEVIVVDNFSNDGLFSKYQQKYTAVEFFENSGNNGFANGCNLGAKNATGNYLLFLNPDTIASKEALTEMLNLSKNNDDYGIVSCSQINPQGKRENEIRLFPTLETLFGITRAIYKKKYQKELNKQYNKAKEIIFPDWVSGSVIFMSKPWFNKVKGWNEDFWMYFEDVDLCKRITEANGKIVISRKAEIIHNHGGASRLNINTSVITKTEVVISKHVYINVHFKGLNKIIALFLLVLNSFLTKFILSIFGLVFYPIPKIRLQFFIFISLIQYYFNALFKGTWLSKKSINYS
jgi:GT2 family glycosyltransferase